MSAPNPFELARSENRKALFRNLDKLQEEHATQFLKLNSMPGRRPSEEVEAWWKIFLYLAVIGLGFVAVVMLLIGAGLPDKPDHAKANKEAR